MQVRQATGNRVSKPAAADPVVRLDAQVTIERPLRGIDNGSREEERRINSDIKAARLTENKRKDRRAQILGTIT